MTDVERYDLLITGGTLITMDAVGTVVENGALAVRDGTIRALGPAGDFKDVPAGRRLDAGGAVVIPGLVNVHTHAAMTLFRGLADDLPLMTWLQDYIFPAEARLDAGLVYLGTQLACAEMILSGTTCFCDMYLFEDSVARAAREAGMRAVVGEVLYDFPSPNYGPLEKGFEYVGQMLEKWRQDPLIGVAVEPHSPYLCSPGLLERAAGLAEDYQVPLVIHLAETEAEVEQIGQRYGCRPVEHLNNLGLLTSNLLACHAVKVNQSEIELLAAGRVKIAHNQESNMKLASGLAPIPDMLDAGICVGLGTDGTSSNNDLDLFREMDTVAKMHKAFTLDPTVMPAGLVLELATAGGARALGLEDEIGTLEVGKRADVVVVDFSRPHLVPVFDPVSHLVYSASGRDVRHVVIDGRVVCRDSRLTTIELEKVIRDINQAAEAFRPLSQYRSRR